MLATRQIQEKSNFNNGSGEKQSLFTNQREKERPRQTRRQAETNRERERDKQRQTDRQRSAHKQLSFMTGQDASTYDIVINKRDK